MHCCRMLGSLQDAEDALRAFQADDAARSVQCSLEQLEVVDQLNGHRASLGEPTARQGVGHAQR